MSFNEWQFCLTHSQKMLKPNIFLDPSIFLHTFYLYQVCILWFAVLLKRVFLNINLKNAEIFYYQNIHLIKKQTKHLRKKKPLHCSMSFYLWIGDKHDPCSESNLKKKSKSFILTCFRIFALIFRHHWVFVVVFLKAK